MDLNGVAHQWEGSGDRVIRQAQSFITGGSSLQSEAMTPRKMIHRLHSLPGKEHSYRPPLHLLPYTT